MYKLVTGLILATALALGGGSALAGDQLIVGGKLKITNDPMNPNLDRMLFLSKDVGIAQPSGISEDPRCAPIGTASPGTASAVLTVTGTNDSVSIPLVCDNWTVNGAGNLFKYKGSSLYETCRKVLVKDNRLAKAVCKGQQYSYNLDGLPENAVKVVLRTGPTNRYCAEFSAAAGCTIVKDGSNLTYLSRDCTMAVSPCASPSGAFVDDISGLF
jgi:hypothetical protein